MAPTEKNASATLTCASAASARPSSEALQIGHDDYGDDGDDDDALHPPPSSAERQVLVTTTAGDGQPPTPTITSLSATVRQRCASFCREHEIGLLLFLIGVWNNAPYVIMLAAAKQVSEGGVALVYIANILPGLLVKASGSYWFDRVSYATRLYLASACMAVAFGSVALFSSQGSGTHDSNNSNDDNNNGETTNHWTASLAGQLFGIALISTQCSLGEASMLAWAGGKIGGHALTWFASGTGLAGPIGFLYHFVLVNWLGMSLSATCILAVVVWASVYAYFTQRCLRRGEQHCGSVGVLAAVPSETHSSVEEDQWNDEGHPNETDRFAQQPPMQSSMSEPANRYSVHDNNNESHAMARVQHESPPMSTWERFSLTLSLWPYMIPLFAVYAAEYACQGGAWTAMGFPVESVRSRASFYQTANWLYQIGVFFSRSSGTLFFVSRFLLWVMPGLQIANLVFFYRTAQLSPPPFWYRPVVLYGLALWTGLLGGAVYVHGYRSVIADVPPRHGEFALATVSLAEGLGVLVADVGGLFLQACLYRVHDIPGAVVRCPSS